MVFLYIQVTFLAKVSFFVVIKAWLVFLASFYIISFTLNLDFQNFQNCRSRVAIFVISPSNQSFILFFTLLVFVDVMLFTTSEVFEVRSEKALFTQLKFS